VRKPVRGPGRTEVIPLPAASDSDAYIWLRPERPPRGPQPPLTRDQIAAAAITVADTLGADGISMRRVAAELGCGTMSLYRHVRNKDELIDIMIDAVAGEGGAPPGAPCGDWRADLGELARRTRDMMLRHPWLAVLLPRRPVLGPNMLAALEFSLSAVGGLGLSTDEMVGMVRTVNAFVHGYTLNELAERQWRRPPAELAEDGWQAAVLPYVRHLTETGKYPYFTRMVIEAEDFPDPDADFRWQLERILDGLTAAIAAAAPRQQP
jgi:AcrR family transcriptional regulator